MECISRPASKSALRHLSVTNKINTKTKINQKNQPNPRMRSGTAPLGTVERDGNLQGLGFPDLTLTIKSASLFDSEHFIYSTRMSQSQGDMFSEPPPSYEASQQSSSHYPQEQHRGDLPPYHNWQETVPDTSTFPPPPVTGYYCSGTGNASSDDAQRAHDFCDNTPLWVPVRPPPALYSSVQGSNVNLVWPQDVRRNGDLSQVTRGRWRGRTFDRNGDCLALTHLPLYFAAEDSPFVREKSKRIYFEVKLVGLRAGPATGAADSSGLAIGFAAGPYPSWRSPGWERGSLGVFSDDGCRFVNDSWGGREFTAPINVGETVGLGMDFSLPNDTLAMADAMFEGTKKCKVQVFFTRSGSPAGGWDLHEETDQESGGIEGLEGDYDLYGAIGLFGGVDFEVCFDPAGWLWRPS